MGWNAEETKKKDGSDKIFKILILSIIILTIIIATIIALLYFVKINTFVLTIDENSKQIPSKLMKEYNGTTFYNIKEMASLLGCDFHARGEYKEYAKDDDKCYIINQDETASFYLNSNKVCKVKVGAYTEDYKIFNCTNNTTQIDNEFYAPIDAIEIAFGITIKSEPKRMNILTLSYIVKKVDKIINPDEKNPVYKSLIDEDFENQKALLYGYIVLCNKKSELYSVKSLANDMELISDKYKKITFLEETKEFLVTNSVDKVGIIDKDGENKVEQIYDSIKVINTNPKLYLVEKDKKYGVIDADGKTIVHTEYNKIGIDNTRFTSIQNQYVLLNKVIPVENDNKYGLFTVEGEKILDVIYTGIGCENKSVRIADTEKTVLPIATIEECDGVVIKNGEYYDLFLLDTKQLISLKVTNIYSVKESGKTFYYIVYKEQEMNLIENLIRLGYIQDDNIDVKENKSENNSSVTNTTNLVITTNETNSKNNNTNLTEGTNQIVPTTDEDIIESR